MRDAFVLSAVRTPISKLRGALRELRPDDLAAVALRAALARAAAADRPHPLP